LSKPRMAVACLAMMLERLFLFSIFVLFSTTQAKTLPPSDCSPCSLPFLYQGRLHFQCTTESPVKGDLFGRCPTQSNLETGEASKDPAHWIRCDNTCPLQSYTPNDVIISKFEHLAKKFPQTAKMVEVGKNNPDVKVAFRLENPHWASVSLASGSVTMSTRRESC